MGADWLADAVVYEIYPQSFADSNGDGVGDLRGVIDHLDHVASLGIDTIWFNPCFASPFVDAGYDVSDYMTIAPRYGTNEEMVELVATAARLGIRVLLDLVAGHTSIEHPWFQAEVNAVSPSPLGDRYIWRTDEPSAAWSAETPGLPAWVPSPGPRPGWYLKNFYDEQPALNFGWSDLPAAEPWRDAPDAAGPRRNRQALMDVIDFWVERGIAGFRVDMAFSLVKDHQIDRGVAASTEVWREIRTWLDATHPGTALVPEGLEPRTGASLAFDADFMLVIHEPHASLFDDHHAGRLPWHEPRPPFFHADGDGSMETFLAAWEQARELDGSRPVLLATADHDFNRLRSESRGPEQLGAALTFLMTWGSVPSLYYGDEIGMRYLPGLPDVEGAICHPAYNRAGCRTPMQWDDSPNAGFSSAATQDLYLPIDPAADRPTVSEQEHDPESTLGLVRSLLALRRRTPALGGRATTEVLHRGYPLAYLRGQSHLVVVNPRREEATLTIPRAAGATVVWGTGLGLDGATVVVSGFGYGVLHLVD